MPIVWRTILVRPETKLSMLHRYLQAAMGWRECHLYAFTIGTREYTIPDREWESDKKVYDARRYTLARLVPKIPAQFRYVYDFGDWWEHVVHIEAAEEAQYRKQYPICVDGAEPCPPEDCGGPRGYRDFLVAVKDPKHPEHDECVTWAKSQLWSTQFSVQRATWAMRDIRVPQRSTSR